MSLAKKACEQEDWLCILAPENLVKSDGEFKPGVRLYLQPCQLRLNIADVTRFIYAHASASELN
ncbi:hypothetical protein [Pseudoalteromonas viridis]|uniref:Uncharacterized protein n=1 Tax=Pseudoalteromonas viridis TaxID=339617 RepID=A0ABX7V7L4_9GAMM|nr:hypothetical protein [Pseudoalteromonas viridis]QTL35761.1 hypothetical protein J5X90_01480 [Pseudoalteromonas viridis]